MTIEYPAAGQIPALKALWQQAFGDPESLIDGFFRHGFGENRCRCAMENGQLAGALYWFDCGEFAYIYAVATAEPFRGRGVCTALMADAHRILKDAGHAGAILVPGSENLFRLYEKMGYRVCCSVREFTCQAAGATDMTRLDVREYARRRRDFLPAGGVLQEGAILDYLQTYAAFYGGADFLLAASVDGDTLICQELLGNAQAGPEILGALGLKQGRFRTPGQGRPFAMYRPLVENAPTPTYLGLALD